MPRAHSHRGLYKSHKMYFKIMKIYFRQRYKIIDCKKYMYILRKYIQDILWKVAETNQLSFSNVFSY